MNVRVSVIWLLSFVLLIPLCCTAARPYAPVIGDPLLEPWRWHHEEALDGLSVLCMDEAPDGSLWFGNIESIVRYDGASAEKIPFDHDLVQKITHTQDALWAKALVVLPDGNLLVLIGDSLVLWSGGKWTVIIPNVGNSVFSARMEQSEDGSVWLSVPEGLWRVSPDLTESGLVVKPVKGGRIDSFALDGSERVWVLEKIGNLKSRLTRIPVNNGVVSDTASWRQYAVPFENDGSEARIAAGRDGLLWYADNSIRSGLEVFNTDTECWLDGPDLPINLFYALIRRKDGSVIAAESGQLVMASHPGDAQYYSNEKLPLPTLPLFLFEASNERLWVVGRIGYVYSIDMGTDEWMTYRQLSFQCETDSGVQWFLSKSLESAISHDLKTDQWLRYTETDGIPQKPYVLFQTRDGILWIAGRHHDRAAVSVFDGEQWTLTRFPEFAHWIEPRAVLELDDGSVLFGAGGVHIGQHAGGVLQLRLDDQKRVQPVKHHAPPLSPYYVTSIARTPDQSLWLGSTVVHRYDGSSPAVPVPGLSGENTVAMAIDSGGSLWVAKEHAGVARKVEEGWKLFSVEDGIASRRLSDLLVLRDGSLLASSEKGISRYDGRSWVPQAYPEWFGMISRWSSLRQSKDGSIWLSYGWLERSTTRGSGNDTDSNYTVRHRPETDPPETVLLECPERVSQPGNTHVKWGGSDLWGRTVSDQLQYSWRLNGGEWSPYAYADGRSFLALDAGNYVIEVRARDGAFNVDPSPAKGSFKVLPPLWRQAWFVFMVSSFSGMIVFLVWMLIRNREKNLIERQAERESHLMEMERIKMGFFTNISHELRTPITVVLGRIEMLLSLEADEQKKRILSIMVRNAQRVADLITQLLDFRKIQEGKAKIELTCGDLVPAVHQWAASVSPLAEQADIKLSLESVAECRGWFDFDKLQKIFTNLLSNAIKYTAAGGTVRIEMQVENVEAGHPVLRWVVEDNGMGIGKEHLGHIFDRFYRVSEASMAAGAGIGLNLTKELVELLGGKIQVESPIHSDEKRPGTRFTVSLPLEGNAMSGDISEKHVCEDPSAVALTNRTDMSHRPNVSYSSDEETPLILVVEDDEDIRSFITDGLGPDYRIETADNGAAGLQIAKDQVPDLIITDLMMPVMDGIALCRELKTSLETSHIPVVMLTAKTSLEHQMEGLKTGADDYVTKPFHMELLRARVANLLESRRLLRENFLKEYSVGAAAVQENVSEREFLEEASRIVEKYIDDTGFNLQVFADEFNMSLSSLKRKVKAVTGRTPNVFIQEYRISRAADLLRTTSEPVSEIAYRTGFDEPANFSKMFKKYLGKSPSQYRSG